MTAIDFFQQGLSFHGEGRLDEAAKAYYQALQLDPSLVDASNNLGGILTERGRLSEAAELFEAGLKLRPEMVEVWNNLGSVRKAQGLIDEALACFRRAIELKPDFQMAWSNYLFVGNYRSPHDPEFIFQEHRRWGKSLSVTARKDHQNVPDPNKRLKIGYLSPDFRKHSVAYSLEPILRHHDKSHFEIFAYSEVRHPDATTERLKGYADHWRTTCDIDDEKVAAQIQDDGIDILVELAGHTARSRLPVLARKPAPVQVSFQGYPNTTGLEVVDFRIADAWTDPVGAERYYVEELVRLPLGFLCYDPAMEVPDVAKLPALKNGFVTFGSFNELAKTTPEVVRLWARVLKSVPNSRLFLKSHSFADAKTADRYRRLFQEEGVGPERLELIGWTRARADHLNLYGKVDIALDPFPYNGTTTTCEALWMGLPLVTLEGSSHVSRVGLSIVTRLGCEGWVAKSPEDYVEKAAGLAADLGRLSGLRSELRGRFQSSSLCQYDAFDRQLEDAYRWIWKSWCKFYIKK